MGRDETGDTVESIAHVKARVVERISTDPAKSEGLTSQGPVRISQPERVSLNAE